MRYVSALLVAAIVALSAHIVVATWFPQVIAGSYPEILARAYAAMTGRRDRKPTVRLEPVEGRPGIQRLILNPKAVARLGLTTAVVEERTINRTRTIAGKILAGSALPNNAKIASTHDVYVVRVPLSGSADTPSRDQSALVRPLEGSWINAGKLAARVYARPIGVDTESNGHGVQRVAYYVINGNGHGLRPGMLVRVELPLPGTGGAPRKVIPSAAILYDPRGRTWAYVNTRATVYVREQLKIDFTDGDYAVLKEGPPVGAKVVISGAFELFGAESRIGQ